MTDTISEFFRIVFGTEYPGQLAIWEKQTKGTKFFQSGQTEEIATYIENEAKSKDLYFGCGLLKNGVVKGRGKVDDVIAIPGFWLDLDIQTDNNKNKKYPSSRDVAFEILKEFPLEPTIINSSGYGMHVFWLFKELWIFENAEDRKRADDISSKFQQAIINLFTGKGYQLDKTSDLARVLRIPGTLNHKRVESVPVNLIRKKNENRYHLDEFTAIIENFKPPAIPQVRKRPKRFGTNQNPFPECKVERILEVCPWFKHCQVDAKDLSEPEWFYMLTVIAFCNDAVRWACKLSESYDGYSEPETLDKVERIQRSHKRSVSCSYVKSNFSGHCDNCRQQVKTPLALGRANSREELAKVGFIYDEEGNLKSLNGNIFSRYILTQFNLLLTSGVRFYLYQDGVWNFVNENQLSRLLRDLLHEFIPDYWTKKLSNSYMDALKLEAPYEESLNTNRDYINLINGMLDLKTLVLKPHSPDYRSSIRIPIEYDIDAKCPNFDKFLIDIFDGDMERITVIWEIMGYCLTSETSAQKAFFFYGKGANGKSLLAEIILQLCGIENTSAVPLSELEKPFSRYELIGKLINLATENEVSEAGLNTASLKAIVVGDPIFVEAKYERGFLYQPFCKMIFSLNNLPYSRDKSWGFSRRLIVIPFNRTFKESDPNTKNYDELKQGLLTEMDGILMGALKGLKRLRAQKFRFSNSKAIDELQDDYKETLNPYLQFVDETIEQGNDADLILNENMRSSFQRWCVVNGHEKLGKSSAKKMLSEIRDAMQERKIQFEVGKKCKNAGKRFTRNIRFVSNDSIDEGGDEDPLKL